jgi:hypothetical protein
MKIIKKFLICLLLSVILISLLGCSSKNKSNNYQEVTAQYKEEFLEVQVDSCEKNNFDTVQASGVVMNKGNLDVNEIPIGVDFYFEGKGVGYSKTSVQNIPSESKRVFTTVLTSSDNSDECIAQIVIYPWEYEEKEEKEYSVNYSGFFWLIMNAHPLKFMQKPLTKSERKIGYIIRRLKLCKNLSKTNNLGSLLIKKRYLEFFDTVSFDEFIRISCESIARISYDGLDKLFSEGYNKKLSLEEISMLREFHKICRDELDKDEKFFPITESLHNDLMKELNPLLYKEEGTKSVTITV